MNVQPNSQQYILGKQWPVGLASYAFRSLLVTLGLTLASESFALTDACRAADDTTVTANATSEKRSLMILPAMVTLHGAESWQRLVLVQESTNPQGDHVPGALVAEAVTWSSSDEDVVRLEHNTVIAVGDGQATVTATTQDGRHASAIVNVQRSEETRDWSFRNDIEAILARRGCSMGACHGALAGKGGFRLSLRGYNPDADWQAITREALGRRVDFVQPGDSLLLTKPTGALPHKGGLRLDVADRDYRILAEWIANGAQPPSDEDVVLQRITVTPENSLLQANDMTQVLVRAHYSDGSSRDVTHWAKFSSTDEAIAGVDENGQVQIRGHGQGAILVWFGSKVTLARLTVPFPHQIDSKVYADAARRNFIDSLVLEQLQALQLAPSPRCDDSTFIRRATLDTIGRLPTRAETEQFINDSAEDKRDRYIESLLASDAFVDYWAYKWSDLLLVNGAKLRPDAVKAYYGWIRQAVADNLHWDEFVKQILTSTGSSVENGATNFFALHQDPENMTENAAQAFLGLSIGCAKCHNHPLEKWTNDQYYAMANLFARVRGKGWGGDSRSGDGKRTIYIAQSGDLIQPTTGRPQLPAPLDAPPLDPNDPADRRIALADWMVAADNPYFSRAISNRLWKNFFGVALVEQTDDLRLSNPASNEPLLAAAADFLVENQYDLKTLMREILRSETYQRSSVPLAENRADTRYYSRYYPRRMMAEVLLDAIDQTLATTTRFDTVAFPGSDRSKTDFYPEGTRAIELYDSAVESYFLSTFGRHTREITCECERTDEPSMVQVLHMSNGETLNPKLQQINNQIGQWLSEGLENQQIIHQLFLQALSRSPTADEVARLNSLLQEYGEDKRREAVEDLCWSVLTSAEFIFHQ
jgi:hypothetical protein